MARNGATMPLCMKNGAPWGSRPFNSDDAHELFTMTFMPVGSNGLRKSWVLHSDSNNQCEAADIGERLYAMTAMHEWATERGIALPTREDSEYYKLKHNQP